MAVLEIANTPPVELRNPDVSVVIPAFKEAQRIGPTLEETLNYLDKEYSGRYELAVVDDGSPDDTIAVAERYGITVLPLEHNQGKGAAVRAGMLAVSGSVRAFMDADGAIAVGEVGRLIDTVAAQQADIAIASRAGGESMAQDPLARRLGHIAFAGARGLIVPIKGQNGLIRDTQCGAKAFSAEAAKAIYECQVANDFSADVEALRIAELLGFTIAEVPALVQNDARSTVRKADIPKMLRTLFEIRRRYPLKAAA